MAATYNDDYNIHENNLETFALLWLDAAVHTSEENREAQQELRSTINHVTTFEESNTCQQYIRSVCPHDRLVLIVSGRLGQEIVPRIHQIRQVSSIYVYCMDKERNEKWAKNFTKVKAVTVQLNELISRIKADQKKQVKIEDSMVINILTVEKNSEQSTTGVNGKFVHSLLLIDVLLRMNSVTTDKQDLVVLCKKEYKGNKAELDILYNFEKYYSPENALWWYTRESFLYKMLNKALRAQNIDLLFLFGFFIRDIHQELKRNQCRSPIRVYRGQVLSDDELKNLRKSIGEFISVNSFFSTTANRHQALGFLNSADILDDLHRVLFVIDADPHVVTTKPFADISFCSKFTNESEVLFMIGSIFRLGNIQQDKDKIWVIHLTLCDDDEHDLRTLFDYMKETYGGGDNAATLLTFSRVLRRMGKFDLAEMFYRRLLNELPSDHPSLASLYYSLSLVLRDKNNLDSSLQYLQKSLGIILQTTPHDYSSICDRYNLLGTVHQMKGQHNIALSYFNKGIELLKQENDVDHIRMAHFYNNMAIVYEKQKNYMEALNLNKQTLIIREQYLPPNHSDIGLSHNNIGNVHLFLGHYNLALEHYNLALNIRLKSLPSDHPHLAKTYANIGLIHEDKGELKQALKYFQEAATIRRQALPPQHPDLDRVENDIKRISSMLK